MSDTHASGPTRMRRELLVQALIKIIELVDQLGDQINFLKQNKGNRQSIIKKIDEDIHTLDEPVRIIGEKIDNIEASEIAKCWAQFKRDWIELKEDPAVWNNATRVATVFNYAALVLGHARSLKNTWSG
jgi:hypothetical protein